METVLLYGYLLGFFIYLACELYYFYADTKTIKGTSYAFYRGVLVLYSLPMLIVWPYSMVVKSLQIAFEKGAKEDLNRKLNKDINSHNGYDDKED